MEFRQTLPILVLGLCLTTVPLAAQDRDDPFATLDLTKTLCADAPASNTCLVAQAQSVAIVANALSEAGNSKDRGSFIDPVRALLTDPSAEIRTAALYALAKLQPDASDTPGLLALLRDPVSNVRAGAWSAAAQSSDPAARRIALRLVERPSGRGYGLDGLAFDADALGFALPEGAEYIWLAADLREAGQLQFLSSATPEDLLAHFAPLAAGPAMTISELLRTESSMAEALYPFLDAQAFGANKVLTLAATPDFPPRLVVIFDDLAFGRTGLAVIFSDGRSLVPKPATPPEITADSPPDDAGFDAALLRQSGFKPDAEPEETDLFMAIAAAGGFGAADYLEIYPEGAYADAARAYLAAPQLVLGGLSVTDTEDITVRFTNLPDGAIADVRIVSTDENAETITEQRLYDAPRETATFEPDSRLVPGIYRVLATVDPGDGGPEIALMGDFDLTLGQAVLEADKADYAPGEQITVRFSGMSGDPQDYVSTAPVGASNNTFLNYAYTEGARAGSLTLPAPTEPGAYELRAFFREDESILRGSLAFTVGGVAAPASETAAAPPVSAPAPSTPTPGTPAPEARAVLVPDKSSYAPGETITITYSDMFGHSQDYVATAPAGAANSSYLQYRYTDGATSGTTTLTAPNEPGAYELRAFFMEDEAILRASQPFTVIGDAVSPTNPTPPAGTPAPEARAVLGLDKPTYAPGETITITYADMFGHTQDYVATAPAGSANAIYLQYRYTDGATSGTTTLTAPNEPGAYELRAFFMEDEAILRASVAFTVK